MGRKKKILVVGGGAAGLIEAGCAADRRPEEHLCAKTDTLSKKPLLIG